MESLFDEVWETMLEGYPYFETKNVDWFELRNQCRPIVEAPDTDYDVLLDDAMECLLSPLADWHVGIRDVEGQWHAYGLGNIPINTLERLIAGYLEGNGTTTANGLVTYGRTIAGGFGYIRVDSMNRSDVEGVRFEAILSEIGEVPGYIVDVRSNGGGSDAISRQIAGCFLDSPRVYAWVQYRNERDDNRETFEFTDPSPLEISSDDLIDDPFSGPVALLTGQRCMSACESFVLMMKTSSEVETFGAETRGSTGNPRETTLSGGTVLRHSIWLLMQADRQTVVEGRGLAPDHPVEFLGFPSDQVVDAAIEWLGIELRGL